MKRIWSTGQQKTSKTTKNQKNRIILPVLPLPEQVMFPNMIRPYLITKKRNLEVVRYAISSNQEILLLAAKRNIDDPEPENLYDFGTIGNIVQSVDPKDGSIRVFISGVSRARVLEFFEDDLILKASVEIVTEEVEEDELKIQALMNNLVSTLRQYLSTAKGFPQEVQDELESVFIQRDPTKLADTVSRHLSIFLDYQTQQKLLEMVNIKERLEKLVELVRAQIQIQNYERELDGKTQDRISKQQKQYYLNERLKAIQTELGMDPQMMGDEEELKKKILDAKMSKEAEEKALRELDRLKQMPGMSAEAGVIRNYIDWLIAMPWVVSTENKIDIEEAEKILEEDHYGLRKPKERILEYLAVLKLVERLKGPILCFVGPPGVGKTSLAKSIARATNRNFVRMSLGGVRDEAEIRGHRRTYIGSMPGRIIQGLRKAKSRNPLFLLDEIDKMSTDFRGDPASALLEVLDPEQNNSFNDHYLDVDFDLSDVLFITTGNYLQSIPIPLRDRMEIIEIPGYIEYEKEKIAEIFLVPKQVKANGLNPEMITFSNSGIKTIIREYTRESGVRNLEREIASVCRKAAKKIVKEKAVEKSKKINIDSRNVRSYLGIPRFNYGKAEENDQIGVATGLAYTETGGDVLSIEATTMDGNGKLELTGKLGDIMQESAKAALSYIRSRTNESSIIKISNDFYAKHDIHIHVPEGAVPKDGPSAGITMATAMVSALIQKPVRSDIAMTGEITLRGRVLPIGGLKEKVLAAVRANIPNIIIPSENEKDLSDIPQEIRKKLSFYLVDNMDKVLELAIKHQSDN